MAQSKSWMLRFIEDYKKMDNLWDKNHCLYGDKYAKKHSIKELCKKYGFLESLIKTKISNLRAYFFKEYNKVKAAKENGSEYISPWFAYRPLLFLVGEESHTAVNQESSGSNESNHVVHNLMYEIPACAPLASTATDADADAGANADAKVEVLFYPNEDDYYNSVAMDIASQLRELPSNIASNLLTRIKYMIQDAKEATNTLTINEQFDMAPEQIVNDEYLTDDVSFNLNDL